MRIRRLIHIGFVFLKFLTQTYLFIMPLRERSGSVVECLTQERGAAGSSLTSITALLPWARTLILALLVQPRKTRSFITERLLMGGKESNQTNKANKCQKMLGFLKANTCMT